ncbi:MAG: hypothetical protein JKY32_09205, partial [Rhizobiales bacterium]|nr:hypothetical protein [Hyphomicrobiales bacterium]
MCKSNLLSSTAITKAAGAAVIVGAFSLPMGFVLPVNHALAACTPLTAGADNVTCIGALDGTLSDALAGNDTIAINTNVGVNAGATVTGGADDDSIALTSSTSLGRNVGSAGQVLGDAGADTITLNFSYVGYFGAGTVSGGVGNDSIVLNNLSYIGYKAGSTGMVLGDAGADTIMLILSGVGYSGAGTVSGGAGNDSIAINSFGYIGFNVGGTGQVLGDAGADTITLSQSVVGYYGAGTVDGGDENDSIALSNNTRIGFAATGTGQVLGNAGSDTITLNNSHVGVSGAGTVSGGAENDSIALTNGSFIGRLAGSTGQVLGDAGADTITIDNSTIGNLGAGTVDGGADNDSIALSNNVVIGRNVGSTGQVLGDAGSDTITINNSHVGYSGAGTVSGGLGNDSIALSGASRIGNLAGSTGQILGDTGADTITLSFTYVGNFGDGTVSGGADNDSIALSTASIVGRNVGSTGQVLGDAGADTITLDNSRVGNALGSAGTVSGGAGGDSIALSNNSVIGRDLGSTGQILGDAGADTITLNNSVVGF